MVRSRPHPSSVDAYAWLRSRAQLRPRGLRPRGSGSSQPGRRLATLCLLLVIGIVPLLGGPTLHAAATGAPGQELLQVPIRWCAIAGSDGANNPGSVGEPTTNDYLWRRHERASDRLLIPGARITGRSAFTASYLGGDPTRGSFPIIDDPKPPPSGPGALGDIVDPNIDPEEFNLAWQACNVKWDALRVPNEPLVGIPAVNIHQFVDTNGTPTTLAGFGAADYNYSGGGSVDLCTVPPTITAKTFTWTGRFAVKDYSLTRGFDPNDHVVAHEFGHAIGLEHGNGLDDNDNNRFDEKCDNAENVMATPYSFMTPGGQRNMTVTSLQRQKMRAVIMRLPGTQIDPPAALINADTISDQRTDAVLDVLDPGVDLATVAVAEIPSTDTFVISHLTFGVIPAEDMINQYLAFADLDNDPNTGGSPADLGFNSTFQGADLVTQVVVEPGYQTYPTAWVYRNGSFDDIGSGVSAEVSHLVGSENGADLASTVTIALPRSELDSASIPFRLQAVAEQLDGDLEFDIMPNGSLSGGLDVVLVPPVYPVCAVEPLYASPGDTVTVEIAGLLPDSSAHVVLGDTLVATGWIESNGEAAIDLTLPGNTRGGPRLVTVGVDGTALTADCYVEVDGELGPWDQEERRDHAAVGSWRVTVARESGRPATTYLTLHGDGTALAADPRAGVGFGAWNATGPNSGEFTLEFAGTDPGEGLRGGTVTARGSITLDDAGAAQLDPFQFEARDDTGNVRDEWGGAATAERLTATGAGADASSAP